MHLSLAASPHPEVARGDALYGGGQGDPALFAQALGHFLAAANAGDAQGQLRAARMYEAGEGADADFSAALRWYGAASAAGNAEAGRRLGDMYYYGRGVGTDLRQAERYYRLGAQGGDAVAQASLAMLLLPSYAAAETSPEAVALLEAVEQSGDADALYLAGFRMIHRNAEETRQRGMGYLVAAAQKGHGKALEDLVRYVRVVNFRPFISTEQQEWIRAEIKRQEEDAKAFARKRLEEIAPLVAQKRYDEALADLDRDHKRFINSVAAWRSAYGSTIWWEAQTRSGRSDPEWSWRLFEWVGHRYDEGMQSNRQSRIVVLGNTASRLVEVGRIGKLRELNDRIVATVKELDGIDMEDVYASARWRGGRVDVRSLPLRYTRKMRPEEIYGDMTRYTLSDGSMGALRYIAEERMLVGDWGKAVFLCDWIEAWAPEALAEAQAKKPGSGGGIVDKLNFTLLLRARIYEILHYPEQAEATYRGIIENGTGAYRGRTVDRAASQLALLLARNGRAEELDLDALDKLADKQRDNQFTAESSQHIAHLAAAMALDARGQRQAARQQVNEVLAFARDKQRPFLLLEALQTSVDLWLANAGVNATAGTDASSEAPPNSAATASGETSPNGETTSSAEANVEALPAETQLISSAEVEAQLFEALEVARSLGLKVAEPALYARYAAYLRQIGDVEAALSIQIELINLLKRFDAVAALPQAEAVRDALYTEYASALVGEGRRQGGGIASSGTDAADISGGVVPPATDSSGGFPLPSDDVYTAFEIDLQPVRIVSVPLPQRAAEAVFVLFNLGRQRAEITLEARGNASLAFDESGTLLEVSGGGEPQQHTATATLSMEGGHRQQVRVRSSNVDSIAPVIALELSATLGSARIDSELEFRLDGEGSSTAVIDAHLLEQNPFYLIPVYHHLSNSTPGVRRTVGLRAVASEPTRIEAYDELGNLLFIDAEGNGSFTDPGDLLATQHINGTVPLLQIEGAERLVEFRYKTHRSNSPVVEVRIQRSDPAAPGRWHTDVVDRILLEAAAVEVVPAQ